MEKQIKSIPTKYKNYKFRSRTEARYAIYFDALGVKWDYELEGYELPSGKLYLPDFYFKDYDVFGEIKPSNFESDPKHSEFVLSSGKSLLIFTGPPSDAQADFLWKEGSYPFACKTDGRAFPGEITGKKGLGIIFNYSDIFSYNYPAQEYALKQANCATFEYGAKNNIKPF